jgi:hypothetical protein
MVLILRPASYGGPAKFARRIHEKAASWDAKGELDFLNSWSYKLGEEREFHFLS